MHDIHLQDDPLACPDYQFYLADQLLVLDHQSQSATLQSFCFVPSYADAISAQSAQIIDTLQATLPKVLPTKRPSDQTVQTNLDDEAFKQILQN